MASSLSRRCLAPMLRQASSSLTHSNTSITCWNVTCRYFSRRRRGGEDRNDRDDFNQQGDIGQERNQRFSNNARRAEPYKTEAEKTKFNQPTRPSHPNARPSLPNEDYPTVPPRQTRSPLHTTSANNTNNRSIQGGWNKPKPSTSPTQETTNTTTNRNTTNTTPPQQPQVNDTQPHEGTIDEQVRTSEVEFKKFKEEMDKKEQLREIEEKSDEGEEDHIEPVAPQPVRARRVATKGFERFITIHYAHANALPSDIARTLQKQYNNIEIKSIATYLEHPKNNIIWLVELESEKQALEILSTPFRFEWLTPSVQPFTLPELPVRYDGKAVLILNTESSVTTGDISGFLQDFGVITVENVGGGKSTAFVAKVSSVDAAEAIVLMYHDYQYGTRQMGIYQLF